MTLETSRISIPADSEHATIVRQFVRLACHRYGCDAVTDNVLQVTDELVANVVEHAAHDEDSTSQTLEVGIVPTQRGVRIEVHDGSHRHPEEGLFDSPDEHQGLRIVASLASSWGVDDEPDGKTVWAEMSGPDGASGRRIGA